MSFLNQKKILYLTPTFFEYPSKIKESIEKQGGIVSLFYFNVKSLTSTFLLNTNTYFYKKFRLKQEREILSKVKNNEYDYVLIQHPYYLSHDFFKTLKNVLKNAIFINYNWDSLKTGNYLEYSQYFDKIFSFDRKDVESNPQLLYLPLFYVDDFIMPNSNNSFVYDLTFIGMIGISDKRYEFLEKIQSQCDNYGINFYKYLFMSKNRYIKTLLKKKKKPYSSIEHRKLSLDGIAGIYAKSKVVIDYNNPLQSGLTMRTFEVLGSGRKLITTNEYIKKEPFYNPSIIHVIDKEKPIIDVNFFKFKNLISPVLISNYHIDKWVENIFK